MAGTCRVMKGDSLSRIAQKVYNDASLWPEIARANRLAPPYTIFAGQELLIPNSSQAGSLFSVSTSKPSLKPQVSSNSSSVAVPRTTGKDLIQYIEANRVLLPEWTIEETLESVYDAGVVVVKVELILRLNFKPQRSVVNFSVANMNSIALSSESEARLETNRIGSTIASDIKFEIDPKTLRPTKFDPAIKSAMILNGEKWYEVSVSTPSPGSIRIEYTPRAVQTKSPDGSHAISGVAALALTISAKPNQTLQPQMVRVTIPVPKVNPSTIQVVLVGVLTVGAAAAFMASSPVAVPFATAAVLLGVAPYDNWKGGQTSDFSTEL
jgi:hypothetical protein